MNMEERLRLVRAAQVLEKAGHECPDCREPMRYVVVSRVAPDMFGLYALCSDRCPRRKERGRSLPIWQKQERYLPEDEELAKELDAAARAEVAIRKRAGR